MRPRNQPARDQLHSVLARRSAVGASSIAEQLDVSIPTLHRLLKEAGDKIITTGKARRARYALRMPLRGDLAELPVYEVDTHGRAEQVSSLALVHPHGTCMSLAGTPWPVPEESRDGWWPGLPYPLYDMRPQGYMGRQLARAEHHRLGVPSNPEDWSDADVLYVLSRIGSDVSGNLILGNPAYEQWHAHKVAPAEPLKPRAQSRAYARLAEQAVSTGVAGSSAGGEFPKFSALRELAGSETPHVLVKFSGADGSPAVRRWADLLVSEHLALECAATLPGVAAAKSRVLTLEGRTFFEVERFDRHGMSGRNPLGSLSTINAGLVGHDATDWPSLAARLTAAGLLEPDDEARIQHLWWFGRLIANTDMHTGNLSFRPHPTLALAPAYDMLPMLYAPMRGGEVPVRVFEPPLPLPPQRACWATACTAALTFWGQASQDTRISLGFRRTCAANAKRLRQAADHV